jgi:hypothetical protein
MSSIYMYSQYINMGILDIYLFIQNL